MQTPAVDGEGLEVLDGGREGKLVAIGRGVCGGWRLGGVCRLGSL